MKEFLESNNVADAPTPISSAGAPSQAYGNAAGNFDLKQSLKRKIKSRNDLDQPKKGTMPMRDNTAPEFQEGPLNTGGPQTDDATSRYFGSFSIEAKRNVQDLLKTHPMFDEKVGIRMNRVKNNTREVLPSDATITQENGGYRIAHDLPQPSQGSYDKNS
jgi:hypothetical protein